MKQAHIVIGKEQLRIKRRKVITQKRGLWLLVLTIAALLVCYWCYSAESRAHVTPDYPKLGLEYYLQKDELDFTDYEVLFQQSGLSQKAVDALMASNAKEEIMLAQDNLFRKVNIKCKAGTIATRSEKCEGSYIPYIEDGDILITFNSHVLGWRNGHAAIVVDAGKRQTLEARVLGTDSVIMSMRHWEEYPSFVVLRLSDASKEIRKKIAEFAKTNLVGIPYQLIVGEDAVKGTHCAHLVWYAYHCFGYELNSDGGTVVTPRDIYESSLLEVIQMYGMDITEFQIQEDRKIYVDME